MSRVISLSESCCITTLRSLAMAMIVSCHIVLSYGSCYYAVLNVGVQIFYVISAFLYAQKDIENPLSWLKKRFSKLYPPLFLFLICVFPILFAVHPELFSFKKLLFYFLDCQYFLGKEQYKELDHLWFMTTIFICYGVTPLLQRFSKRGFLSVAAVAILMGVNYYVTNGKIDWLLLYSFAYLLFRQTKEVSYMFIIVLMLGLALVLPHLTWSHIISVDWQRLLVYNLTSILLLIISMRIFNHFNWSNVSRMIEWISSYSFELYIVHNFFIHGSFSCSYLTNIIPVNVASILVISIVSAVILKRASYKMSKLISQ